MKPEWSNALMNTLSLDVKYERHICEQLLDIARAIYAAEADTGLPTAAEVMKTHKDATPEEIRFQIQEVLDFLSVNTKYMLLDREALIREIAEAKKEERQ